MTKWIVAIATNLLLSSVWVHAQGTMERTDLDFKAHCTVRVEGEELETAVYFVGTKAITDDPESTVFDLDLMTWRDPASGAVVPISQCEAWAKASVERTMQSLAKLPDDSARDLVLRLMDPQFTVSETEGALIVENPYIHYRIEPSTELDEKQAALFFAFDRLNAYQKAMVLRKMPPSPQLAVTRELEARGWVPKNIRLRMEVGADAGETEISCEYSPLSDEDLAKVARLLER